MGNLENPSARSAPGKIGPWRGRGADYRSFFGLGGAGVARAGRGRGADMACDHSSPARRQWRATPRRARSKRAPPRRARRELWSLGGAAISR
eukprot:gene15638-biopygen21727